MVCIRAGGTTNAYTKGDAKSVDVFRCERDEFSEGIP